MSKSSKFLKTNGLSSFVGSRWLVVSNTYVEPYMKRTLVQCVSCTKTKILVATVNSQAFDSWEAPLSEVFSDTSAWEYLCHASDIGWLIEGAAVFIRPTEVDTIDPDTSIQWLSREPETLIVDRFLDDEVIFQTLRSSSLIEVARYLVLPAVLAWGRPATEDEDAAYWAQQSERNSAAVELQQVVIERAAANRFEALVAAAAPAAPEETIEVVGPPSWHRLTEEQVVD